MTFRVTWLQSALNELAAAWLQADVTQRAAITAATDQLDKLLQIDPQKKGESRAHGQRVTFQLPLGIVFEVREQSAVVRILHAWTIKQRP